MAGRANRVIMDSDYHHTAHKDQKGGRAEKKGKVVEIMRLHVTETGLISILANGINVVQRWLKGHDAPRIEALPEKRNT